jgi:hypothetical protein
LDPDGPWDCNSNCNLGTMFTAWAEQFEDGTTVTTDGTTVDGDGSPGNPIRLDVAGAVAAICGHETAAEALVACLISADAGNVIGAGSDGRLFAAGTVVTETPITGNGSEANPVGLDIPATISEDGINLVTTGTDGKLLVTVAVAGVLTGTGTLADPIRLDTTPTGTVQQICGDDEAHDALAACLISNDPLNILVQGLDGGLLVPASSSSQPEGDGESITVDSPFSVIPDGLVATICGSETAREALSLCLLSSDTDNGIQVGSDGGLYSPEGIFDGQTILFEIAFSRAIGYVDGDLLSAYITPSGFTIPADFPNSRVFARAATGDIQIYVAKNNVFFAQIQIVSGVPNWIMVADTTFEPGDVLEFRAGGNVDFELLAVTVVAHRQIVIA